MILVIPIQDVAAQTFSTTVNGQSFRFRIMQKSLGLFVDIYFNDVLIVAAVIALNAVPLIRAAYLGVLGNFAFVDTLGELDPEMGGLGSRYILTYYA